MPSGFEIRTLAEAERRAATSIFIEAYYPQLRRLDRDLAKLEGIFRGAFILERFIGAFAQGELAGFLALTDGRSRCLKMDEATLVSALGAMKGHAAYRALKREFEDPIPLRESGLRIESVATAARHRGRGVATALVRHAMAHNAYLELDVLDSNAGAYELYKRLGFATYREERASLVERLMAGYKKRIFMCYRKGAGEAPA